MSTASPALSTGRPAYIQAMERLPVVDARTLLDGRQLLVIAPHPDDESLGVGGLIAEASALGAPVTVVFLTDGERSHIGSLAFPPERLGHVRRDEARHALAELGVAADRVHFLGLGDGRLPAMNDGEKEAARQRLGTLMPGDGRLLVCVTAGTDPHGDHQAAYELALSMSWAGNVDTMAYPVWTWTLDDTALPVGSPAGVRVDIAASLPAKRKAIAAHRSQHGEVVMDASESFVLDEAFVDTFLRDTEVLLWPA